MRFSVLLPTLNRLTYLRYAVESVRRQDTQDWEIIVSDNCSQDDIAGYVRGLDDPRVVYVRTDRRVPVTDNWNNAMDHCHGDYVIMLGDDDCLMRGYFHTIGQLIEQFKQPDCVYYGSYQYAYPEVMPGYPDGYLLEPPRYDIFADHRDPFLLDRRQAMDVVRRSMSFRLPLGYNMQHLIVSRACIESLAPQGPFFQSPYPDYYATNVLFLMANRVVVYPHPLVTIGITPKSFGFYFFNDRENQGIDFLDNRLSEAARQRLGQKAVPGLAHNTNWLFAMEFLKDNYADHCPFTIDYDRYRRLQAMYVVEQRIEGKAGSVETYRQLRPHLKAWERLAIGNLYYAYRALARRAPGFISRKMTSFIHWAVGQYPDTGSQRYPEKYENILEVFERVEPIDARIAPPSAEPITA